MTQLQGYCKMILLVFLMTFSMLVPVFLMSFGSATDPTKRGWPLSNLVSPYAKMVPMSDGVKLETMVYDPGGTFNINEKGPTLLIRTPYGIQTSAMDYMAYSLQQQFPNLFVVTQDMRGRYNSQGTDTLFGNDYSDGADTYNWLMDLDGYSDVWWTTNEPIGSYGASALGINQYCYAGQNLPNLVAQYIEVAAPDQYDQIFFQGGEFEYNTIMTWSSGQGSSSLQYATSQIATHPQDNDSFWQYRTLYNPDSNLWDRRENVHASAVHFGGWDDVFSNGIISGYEWYNYNGASDAQGHQVLIMAGMGHGAQVGDINWPNAVSLPTTASNWENNLYQTELYDANGARGSQSYENWWNSQPKVFYYVYADPAYYGIDPGACTWRTANSWPVPSTQQNWYLHVGANPHAGVLDLNIPSSSETSNSISYIYDPSNPCPTNGGNNLYNTSYDTGSAIGQGSTDQRGGANGLPDIVDRSDVITFTSSAFTAPYEFTGDVTANLYVNSNKPDTDFVGKLIDVFPDGRQMLITEGDIRAWHALNYNTMNPAATTPYLLNVDLGNKAWRLEPGHKLELLITSSDYPHFLRNPNTGAGAIPVTLPSNYQVATNTIWMEPGYSSSVSLPITVGWLVPGNAPAVHITSQIPTASPSTNYTVQWTAANCDNLTIQLNNANYASNVNPAIGQYALSGLTGNIDNNITIIGQNLYYGNSSDSILIHPYTSPPEINITSPHENQKLWESAMMTNWTIDATNSSGLSQLWIETDQLPETEINNDLTSYALNFTTNGTHWIKIYAEGVNGLQTSYQRNFSLDLYYPRITITSAAWGFSDAESYNLSWTNFRGGSVFSIMLNQQYYLTNIPNATSITQTVSNLIPNQDNNLTVETQSDAGNITATIICHPYRGTPQIMFTTPQNNTLNYGTSLVVAWTINTNNTGGIGQLNLTSSSGFQVSLSPDATYSNVTGFTNGSKWVTLTAQGNNGYTNESSLNFSMDVVYPTITILNPNWGYSPAQNFTIDWVSTKCTEFYIWVDGSCQSGPYLNSSEMSAPVLDLAADRDNNVQIIGITLGNCNVSASMIAHPYTAYPDITIENPINGSTIYHSYVDFQWVNSSFVLDAGGVANISIFASNGISLFFPDDTVGSFRIENFSAGLQWAEFNITGRNGYISVMNLSFVINLSDMIFFPQIQFTTIFNGEVFSNSNITVQYTATDEVMLDQTWMTVVASNGTEIASQSVYSGQFDLQFESEGIYNITLYATNLAENINQTSVIIYVDLMAPQIQYVILPNNGIVPDNFGIIYNITDLTLDKVFYSIDNGIAVQLGPQNLINVSESLPNFGQGLNNLTITAFDRANRSSSYTTPFTIDTIAPTVWFNTFENGSEIMLSNNVLTLRCSLYDADLPATVWIYIDGNLTGIELPITMISTSFGTIETNITLSFGVHTIRICGADLAGNPFNVTSTATIIPPPSTNLFVPIAIMSGVGIIGAVSAVILVKKARVRHVMQKLTKEEIKRVFGSS